MSLTTKFSVIVMMAGLFIVTGCGKKGSCEKLVKMQQKCSKHLKKKDPKDLLAKCELNIKRGNPMTKIEVSCSGKSGCKSFQQCQFKKLMSMDKDDMKNYRKKEKEFKAKDLAINIDKFIKKPVKDIYKDIKKVDVVSTCRYVGKTATEQKKKACKKLNTFIYGEMTKDFDKQVKAGKYDTKHNWDITGLADKIGKKAQAKMMVKYADVHKNVAKKIKEKSKYMPYSCNAKNIDKLVAKDAVSKKYLKLIVTECFDKMALTVLTTTNSNKNFYCSKSTKDLMETIKKHKIANAAVTKIAAEVQAKCDKKK